MASGHHYPGTPGQPTRLAVGACITKPRKGCTLARLAFRLVVEQRHGVVPETHVDADILSDGTDSAGAARAPGRRSAM